MKMRENVREISSNHGVDKMSANSHTSLQVRVCGVFIG
jgi:hypothetical protein